VALDDLASAFQLTIREEAGALTVSYKGRVIVLTANQAIASIGGRLLSLSAPPVRSGNHWFVPLDFINRGLAPLYDTRLDLRRASHLLVVGDLRVPRIVVRQEIVGAVGRVTIDASPRAASTVTQDGTQRITIKFEADALDPLFPPLQPQGVIQGIRILDAATLGIDPGPRFTGFRSSTQTLDNSTRLVLDLAPAQLDAAALQPPPAAAPAESRPVFGSPSIRTVAVDAGHGGSDTGTRGGKGTLEKDLTLVVARRLRTAVEGRLGVRVILTRDEDRLVPLDDRAAVANHNKADLFISLHAGASFRSSASGAEVYLAAFDDSPAKQALVPERVPAFGGGYRDIELVPWNLAQIRYSEPSERMATLLAQQFQGRVPLAPRPVERAPLRVLKSANMPAVLVEMGYLTSADQERLLTGTDFQNALVEAVVDAISKFFDLAVASEGSAR
jgi:N-acetylmuramoyl-L-alanine amidase